MATPDKTPQTNGAETPESPYVVAGVEGYKQAGGLIIDDPLAKLNDARGRKLYREMADSDSTVGAVIFGLEMWMRCVPWTLEPASTKDGDAVKGADFMNEVLFEDTERPWSHFISDVSSTWVNGWSWFDLPLKRRLGYVDSDTMKSSLHDDGKIGLADFAFRPQESLAHWDIDETTGFVRGWEQQAPIGGANQYLDRYRALHLVGRTNKGSPEGKSILRNAWRSYYYLKNIQNIEAIAIERELNGFPIVKVPGELWKLANPAEGEPNADAVKILKQYEDMARNIKNNSQAGAVIASDTFRGADGQMSSIAQYSIELLSTNGQRSIDTVRVKEGYQQDIARSMLFDFVMLGQGDKGSFALSQSKIDMCLSGVDGWVAMLADGMNRSVIPYIWRANGFPMETMPKATPGSVAKNTLDALGTYIEKVAKAGFDLSQSQELRDALLTAADLPKSEIPREQNVETPPVPRSAPRQPPIE